MRTLRCAPTLRYRIRPESNNFTRWVCETCSKSATCREVNSECRDIIATLWPFAIRASISLISRTDGAGGVHGFGIGAEAYGHRLFFRQSTFPAPVPPDLQGRHPGRLEAGIARLSPFSIHHCIFPVRIQGRDQTLKVQKVPRMLRSTIKIRSSNCLPDISAMFR